MASIDLADAYYSLAIGEKYKKFLRFIWNGKLYEFNCMPNGLSSAPRTFTKILKPIFSLLRSMGHISVYYLDDSWLMGSSMEECKLNMENTATVLTEAGFVINKRKSVLEPAQTIKFLGFCLNSCEMSVSLPMEKRILIFTLCEEILQTESFSIRYLARFIGVLVASLPAVQHGDLYYRFLEQNRNSALIKRKGNFNAKTSLDADARDEVLWWKSNIGSTSKSILVNTPDLIITTDASMLGWGAIFGGISTGGPWSTVESNLHINLLEIKAVQFGIQSFLKDESNKHIRIRTDNTTAVTYINKLGGVKSIDCHKVVKEIWSWAI